MKPIRMCTVCRKRQEKEKYIRIVRDENNNAIYDENHKINSRAIYFCKDINLYEPRYRLLWASLSVAPRTGHRHNQSVSLPQFYRPRKDRRYAILIEFITRRSV